MPYPDIEGAKKAGFPTTAEGIALTVSQINKLASIYDAIKKAGSAENPMAAAWAQWKKLYKKEGNAWVKQESDNHTLPETYDIKGVEIFADGNHKGHTYTEQDIENLVNGFYETKSEIKPYIKLGHDEKQKLAQKSGLPALGWIENLRKKGKKLIADFSKVPKVIYDLVNAGAYRRISSEIFRNIPVGGKVYKHLLKAVSFLGGDTPAVGGLEDIVALYNVEPYKSNSKFQEYEFDIDGNRIKEANEMPEIKELEKKVEKLELEKAEADKAKAEAEKAKQEAEQAAADEKKKADEALAEKTKLEEEAAAKKEADTKAEVAATVKKLVEDKHILPASKDAITTLLFDLKSATEVKMYKIGDDEKSSADIITDILSKQVVDMNTEENSETGVPASDEEGQATHVKAVKYMKDNKVSYKEALIAVSPSLWDDLP